MHCLWEIIDNGVDEALAGAAHHVEVTLHPDDSVEVHDDGRGIPTDKEPRTGLPGVEVVATKLHAGGKFGGGSYVATGGLHGVGLSVVNALSARMDIDVERAPSQQGISFKHGTPGVFDGEGPRAAFTAKSGLTRKGGRVAKNQVRHPHPLLAGPAGLHQGRDVRVRGAAGPGPADGVHRPRPRAGDPRPARAGDARGEVPARGRHRGVRRVPGPRRAGHRDPAAAGQGHLHRDRAGARREGPHDPAGGRARARGRHRGALGDRLRHRAALVRQRHRHPQGRHPRQRLRAGAAAHLQRRHEGRQGAQGQRRRRHQGRRPRGADRRGHRPAGRAAVRGPDQGDPRHAAGPRRRAQGGRRRS